MIDLRLGPYLDALADVPEWDALITDCPYSTRTHSGYDGGVATADRPRGDGATPRLSRNGKRYRDGGAAPLRRIGYSGWTADDVRTACDVLVPRTRGWCVTITDHVLAPVWSEHLERHGRYVFAPLPWVGIGSRVRLAGDGPSSWTCWIVVARPRSAPWSKWGTLPGAYVLPGDPNTIVVGAKPLSLMRALVRDYTRPGDLVCDPCAGGATTAVAARAEGRRFVGAEIDPETHAAALARLADPPLIELAARQPCLLLGADQ